MNKKRPLRALTLIQPWATAFTHLGKRLENRDWDYDPSPKQLEPGDWLAIHAGLKFSDGDLYSLAQRYGEMRIQPPFPQGAIVGLCRYVGVCRTMGEVPGHQREWWANLKRGLLFEDRMFILGTPLRCSGAQGIWEVPETTVQQIRPAFLAWRGAA